MKGKKIIIILIIINILTMGIIYNLIKKDYLNNERIIVKAMTEGEYEDYITSLNQSHIEYANYIQESKTKIASAITDMGVATSNEETSETMANNIRSIVGGSSADKVSYDNTTSGLESTNVQGAVDELNNLFKNYIAKTDSVLWEAGVLQGFTSFIASSRQDVNVGGGYGVDSYGITVWSNITASGGLMLNESVDLTNVSKLILCYDIKISDPYALGDFGIGVSKTPNNVSSIEKKILCSNANLSVTKGILELDVSELSGDYYVYIPLKTRNTGNTEYFYIRSIKKEYL